MRKFPAGLCSEPWLAGKNSSTMQVDSVLFILTASRRSFPTRPNRRPRHGLNTPAGRAAAMAQCYTDQQLRQFFSRTKTATQLEF